MSALRTSVRVSVGLLLGLASAGCSSGSNGTDAGLVRTGSVACDPLAPTSIELGRIIGVGEDAQATLYVDAESGIFVSDQSTLWRQVVRGSGQEGENEYVFSYAAPDGGGAGSLLVETSGETADAMALAPEGTRAFLDQPDSGVTPLQLMDPSVVSGMAVVNTPSTIEYLADVSNGDVLLATRPLNEAFDSLAGGLAIFYGPPSRVAQRTVTAFSQSRSGNGTVSFDLDGATASYQFGWNVTADGGSGNVLSHFTDGTGSSLELVVRPSDPDALGAMSFACFAP